MDWLSDPNCVHEQASSQRLDVHMQAGKRRLGAGRLMLEITAAAARRTDFSLASSPPHIHEPRVDTSIRLGLLR